MSEIKEKSVVIVPSASKQISVQGEDSTIKDTAEKFIKQNDFESYSLKVKPGKAVVVGYKRNQTLTLAVEQTEHGGSIEATAYKQPDQKADFAPDIMKLRKEGKTQAEVAARLNMSQSYVSLIERQYK